MPAIISAFLAKFSWTSILGFLVGVVGVVYALFAKQHAKAVSAEAKQKVTEVKAQVAQGDAKAEVRKVEAQKNAATAQVEAAKIPESDLDTQGAAMGIVRD